ncbi:MAG TPA: carboxypeptidase-like regulatory domain-containing protein [Actinomycetota bacterium]|nr:carboxypeptidase-like regulatory domain-containing protein [Actinomycetota bacterium]
MPTLTGKVTVEGSPTKTATVELHNSQGDVIDQVQTNDDGQYTYHLSAGSWTLNVWDERGNRAKQEVTLSEDDTTVDLELAPGK